PPRPHGPPPRRLPCRTRLACARTTLVGGIMYRAVVGSVAKQHRAALALPDSLERDLRVKHTHFLLRMMPSNTLRGMVMSSGGQLAHHTAEGIALLAAGHPLRALRAFRRSRRQRGARA